MSGFSFFKRRKNNGALQRAKSEMNLSTEQIKPFALEPLQPKVNKNLLFRRSSSDLSPQQLVPMPTDKMVVYRRSSSDVFSVGPQNKGKHWIGVYSKQRYYDSYSEDGPHTPDSDLLSFSLDRSRSSSLDVLEEWEHDTDSCDALDTVADEQGRSGQEEDNERRMERVQSHFPHDDLQLHHGPAESLTMAGKFFTGRRKSAPSAVLIKQLSSGPGARHRTMLPLGTAPMDGIGRPGGADRQYIYEGAVQLTASVQTQDRYIFLFNDLLLVAKQKSSSPPSFRLKNKIRVSEIWLGHALDEVADLNVKHPDRSFVIGWPTTNSVATFQSVDLRDRWWDMLSRQITLQKETESPRSSSLRVKFNNASEAPQYVTMTASNTTTAAECVKSCLEQLKVADSDPKDYQLWVSSGKDSVPYPLIGHEVPLAIRMNHHREMVRGTSDSVTDSLDLATASDALNSPGCQFVLQSRERPTNKHGLDESTGKKWRKMSKKSPFRMFRRSASKGDLLSGALQPPSPEGKLFKHKLWELCPDGKVHKTILELMQVLFRTAPFTDGVFRKSANAKVCTELRRKLDAGEEIASYDDFRPNVIADVFLKFLRELPETLVCADHYESCVATNDWQDNPRKLEEVKKIMGKLPGCNLNLLRHFMCILHHIAERHEENQMTSYNLAVCVGQSLLQPHALRSDTIKREACVKVPAFVKYVIDHVSEILGPDTLQLFGTLHEPDAYSGHSSGNSGQDHTAGLLRTVQDNSSVDSLLERDYYPVDPADIMGAENSDIHLRMAHLSPTCSRDSNLSRDSGLTLSDTQLNMEEGLETERSGITLPGGAESMPKAPPRKHRRRGPGDDLDLTHSIPEDGPFSHETLSVCSRQASYSLSMNEDTVHKRRSKMSPKRRPMMEPMTGYSPAMMGFPYQQGAAGTLTKSASGAHLFLEEDGPVYSRRRSHDPITPISPSPPSSRDSGHPSSPFYTAPSSGRPSRYELECSASAEFVPGLQSAAAPRFTQSYSGSHELSGGRLGRQTVYSTDPRASNCFHLSASASAPITPEDSDDDVSGPVSLSSLKLARPRTDSSSAMRSQMMLKSPPASVLLRSIKCSAAPIVENQMLQIKQTSPRRSGSFGPSDRKPKNNVERSPSESQVSNRPSVPPSYHEAVMRSNILKKADPPTISEKDRISQTVNSARAKELYQASVQQYFKDHKDDKTTACAATGKSDTLRHPRPVSLMRSKSDSQEHLEKLGRLRLRQHNRTVNLTDFETRPTRSSSDSGRNSVASDCSSRSLPVAPSTSGMTKHGASGLLFYVEPSDNSEGSRKEAKRPSALSLNASGSRGSPVSRSDSRSSTPRQRPSQPPPYREPPQLKTTKERLPTPHKSSGEPQQFFRKNSKHMDRPIRSSVLEPLSTDESYV